MVLSVHASSTCDVCLDPYSWDENSRRPHFIVCGHIFCGTCLESIQPQKCPLCRTLFSSSDIHKLNVDPYLSPGTSQNDIEIDLPNPPTLDNSDEFANDLMKKLLMSYDTDDEEVLYLADEWLENREPDVNCPVRRARKLVVEHRKLKIRKTQDRRIIKGFQAALQETMKKAEESAQRMTEKHETLQRQLEESQKEAERLRELHRSLLNSKKKDKKELMPSLNPLPTPPRPIGSIPPVWAHKISTSLEATPSTAVESRYATPQSVMTPIYAPAPRYPAHTEAQTPGIVQSFGLLTFGDQTATSGKAKRPDKRGKNDLRLGPGQLVDGSAYWTCQTTNEGLPEINTPQYNHSKVPNEHPRYGRGRLSGA